MRWCTYLVRGVVDDQVHDELHAPRVNLVLKLLPVVESTVRLVNIAVVGNVVAHVRLRRLEYG